jgi:2-(1,2-epoxy-1,2-dihydrophenyl)acetyl-CoA isomerase
MSYQTILIENANGIATITLNRPEVMNALNPQMRVDLTHAFRTLPETARVLVLTGAGRGFCSGQDLGEAHGVPGADIERVLREEYTPMLDALAACPLPTIAAVNGAAAGAGANLALAADVVIAAESARFTQAFTRIGLIPDAGGTYWLPRQIGLPRAMGAALFAEPVGAVEAAEWGMIWQAVPDERLAEVVAERAATLAAGPTLAYRLLKEAFRESASNDRAAQLDVEARLQGEAGRSRDFKEGILAFSEKRPPRYEGR